MFASWMAMMASVTNEIETERRVEREEEAERQALVVEERSCVAHVVRKLRNAAKGKTLVDSDDDDDESIAKAHAQGSSLLFKFKLVAERRQIEWDLYEARCRELRRTFEDTNDPAYFDAVAALVAPGHNINRKKAAAKRVDDAAEVSSLTPREVPAVTVVAQRLLPPMPLTALPHPPAVAELPAAAKQAMQEEGFSRASIIMEERASRRSLSNTFAVSLIEGDDEMRVRTWNRESNDAEIERREELREEEAKGKRAAEHRELANRHKSIAIEQTQRVFLKKMLREKRVAIQFEEGQLRDDIHVEWAKWFNISIVLRNFRSILTIVPLEEAASRNSLIAQEWRNWHTLIVRLWKYHQRTDALLAEALSAMDEMYDTETFLMRYQIEMHAKTVREQEEEMKRRDALREIADAEELERLTLQLIFGASPLTEQHVEGQRSWLVLRPVDELKIITKTHPPSAITDVVKQTFRSNQENNSLFMALESKYIKVRRRDGPGEASQQRANKDADEASQEAAPLPAQSVHITSPAPSSRPSLTNTPAASSPVAAASSPKAMRPAMLAAIAIENEQGSAHSAPRSHVVAVVSPKLDAIRQFQPDAPVMNLRDEAR